MGQLRTDASKFWLAAAAAGGLIGQQVAGKVVRDALFLSSFPATFLPYAVATGAAISLVTVLVTSRLFARRGPGALVPQLLGISAALFGAEWIIAIDRPGLAAVLIYLHTAAIGGIVISGFWSVVNERFDPHTARHNIARIATGATVGGFLGGLGAERVGAWLDPNAILLMIASVNLVAAFLVHRLSGISGARDSEPPANMLEGLKPLVARPYLRTIALVIVSVTMLEVFLEFALNTEAARVQTEASDLVSFFSFFYTASAFATFVVQVSLTRISLDRLGLSGTLILGPAIVILAGVAALADFRLTTIAIACAVQSVIANSLFRAAYELLYTPIAPELKRPTKVVIDVGLARLSSMIGSGAILALLALVSAPLVAIVAIAITFAVVVLVLCLGLHSRYIRELATSLELGVVHLAPEDAVDLTTRRTIASTTVALDRDRLLAEIEALRAGTQVSKELALIDKAVRRTVAETNQGETERRIDLIRVLSVGTSEEIQERLRTLHIEPHLVSFLVPLLGRSDAELVNTVSNALTRSISTIAGQLTDTFMDAGTPNIVRHRLARVLGSTNDARVVHALIWGLSEPNFDLRFFSGRALAKSKGSVQVLALQPELVLDKIRRELAVSPDEWRLRHQLQSDRARTNLVHRGFEHVFNLLSLVLDGDVVELCFGALCGTDDRLRGTALEYLENVLPRDIAEMIMDKVVIQLDHADSLRPFRAPRPVGPPRPAAETAEDLKASAAAIRIAPGELDPV